MIDFSLTEEQRMLQATARAFATEEIAPAAARIEAAADPGGAALAEGRAVLEKGAGLGFLSMLLPEDYGGLGRPCIDAAIVMEELGAADVAMAADLFSLNATILQLVAMGGSPAQKERFLRPVGEGRPMMFSGGLSEPQVAGSDLFFPTADPAHGVRTHARREGDRYVLEGTKSAFITNGGVADWYFIMARTDLQRPMAETLTIFAVPADAKGLSFARPTELIGWRTTHHAQLYLDHVEVPVEDRIGAEGDAMRLFGGATYMPIALAACFVGLARAAEEYALAYARERRSWGAPIMQHQAVGLKLADMMAQTRSARLLAWDAAVAADQDPRATAFKSPAAKSAAVDAAIFNASKAVEILGGYGVTREYRAGKFLNDAYVGYACDFTRDMLRLAMLQFA